MVRGPFHFFAWPWARILHVRVVLSFQQPTFQAFTTINNVYSAAWSDFHLKHVIIMFDSTELLTLMLLKWLLDHPMSSRTSADSQARWVSLARRFCELRWKSQRWLRRGTGAEVFGWFGQMLFFLSFLIRSICMFFFLKHTEYLNINTSLIFQRISFEKEIPSGESQAGSMSQTSCPVLASPRKPSSLLLLLLLLIVIMIIMIILIIMINMILILLLITYYYYYYYY